MSSLKEKAISGMMWNAVERFGSTFFLFLSNLVLARLLMPSDFGTVAMLMVFISISETIVEAGFSSALIQKKNVDDLDYSTAFLWTIFLSLLLYLLLYFTSPQISNFYRNEELCFILRIQGLVLPLNSLVIIHIAKLKRELKFKLTAKINLLSVVVGTIAGVIAAFIGWGVWSLVLKMLVSSCIMVLLYYSIVKWVPNIRFDFERFSVMFRFGIWILLSRLVNTLFHNMMALLIGKFMSASTLGYYNQAKKLEDIPRSTLSSIVNNVAFPVFSKIQGDLNKFKINAKKCVRSLSFISTPLMICAIAIARPLILLLFTEKWLPVVEYFQLLCLGALALTPLELNYEFINSLGFSKISFNIRLFQRGIGVLLMFVGIIYGIYGLLLAYIFGQLLSFFIAGYISGIRFGYGLFDQINDMLPSIVISFLSLFVCYIESILLTFDGYIIQIVIRAALFFGVYGLLSAMFCNEDIRIIKESIFKILKNKKVWKNIGHK